MSDVFHTDNPRELTVRFTHPTIKSHKCPRPGIAGWTQTGEPIACSCLRKTIAKEWKQAFGNHPIKSLKFSPEAVTAKG